MGNSKTLSKLIIFSLALFINSNLVVQAHEKSHEQVKNKTANETAKKSQLLNADQLNVIRRERQLDNLHSLFTKVIGTQNPEDQFRLGEMFQRGTGVEKDDVQAYVWTALALTNGYPGATKTLRDLETSMSAYEVDYAIDLLRKIRELR